MFTPFKFTEGKNGLENTGWLSNFTKSVKDVQQELQQLNSKDLDNWITRFNKATINGTQNIERFMTECDNPSFKNYINTYEGGAATVHGYTEATKAANIAIKNTGVASKLAAVGMKALSVAANIGIWLAISELINLAVTQIGHWINAQQEAIETANKLTEAYKTTVDTSNSNIKTLENLKEKYDTLSKGVDSYGNNVSLSTDEYKEYKSIVEQVIGISPSLQTGYDKEGKAIANNNGLIERAIELEKEKIRVEQEKITSDDKLWKNAKGKIGEYEKQVNSTNQKMQNLGTSISSNLSDNLKNSKTKYKEFLSIFNLNDSGIDKTALNNQQGYITQLLQDMGNLKKVANALKENPLLLKDYVNSDGIDKVQNNLTEYVQALTELDNKSKNLNPTLQIIPKIQESYDQLSDTQKNFITNYINGFNELDINTEEKLLNVKRDIQNLTNELANNTGAKSVIDQLFSIDKSKISATNYKKEIDNLIQQLAKYLNLDAKKLKIILKLDIDDENINTMLSDLERKVKPETYNFVKNLSIDDLKIAYKLENIGDVSPSELSNQILKVKNAFDKTTKSADNLSTSIDTIQKSTSTWETVKKEVSDYGTISIDSLKKIIEQYPQLEFAVAQYQAGIISTSELINDLESVYAQDKDNYKRSLIDKLSDNDDFYNKTISKNSTFVNNFKTLYGIDLTNYKNLAQAKSEVDNKLLRSLINNWSNFYNAQTDTFTEDYARLGMASITSKDAAKKAKEIENQVNKYRKAKHDLDKITLDGISFNTSNSLSNNSKSAKGLGKSGKDAAKSAESAAKKAAQSLKEQYELELKQIETNKELGKYDKNRMSYYNALSALQKKWAKSKLDTETKQELQVKVHQALKDYQEDSLELSYKELEARIKIGKIEENSPQHLQNLLEIQKNLIHGNMELANTDENRLALQEKIYEVQKAMYEKENENLKNTVSAVERIADKKIKKLKDEEERQEKKYNKKINRAKDRIDDLKEQEDELQERYKKRIQPIQDEIDALQRANEERSKELALERAKEEFERAKSQKSVNVFRAGKGFTYEIDRDAVKKAQEDLNNAKTDKRLFDLNQQKEALERQVNNEKDKLEKSIKYWEDYQKELEDILAEKKEALEEDIEDWEDYKDKWSDILDDYQYEQDMLLVSQQLAVTAEAEILSQRLEVVDTLKNKYIALQKEMSSYAEKMIRSAEKAREAKEQIKSLGGGSYLPHYASGIDEVTKPHNANIDENGEELVFNGRVRHMEIGDTVFSADKTQNFIKNLVNYPNILMNLAKEKLSNALNVKPQYIYNTNVPTNNVPSIKIGDIHLHEVQKVDDLSERIVSELPSQMIQDLNKRK